MPPVRKHQEASVQGRTQRPQEASTRPFEQSGDGEGEGDGEADIAGVEDRRVHREPGILQQRVDVLPVHRRRPDAQERVGRGEREQQEPGRGERRARRSPAPAAPKGRPEPKAATAPPQRARISAPEQDRALVVPPGAGDPVDQRLQAVAVLRDVEHRVSSVTPLHIRQRKAVASAMSWPMASAGAAAISRASRRQAPRRAARSPAPRRACRRAPGRNARSPESPALLRGLMGGDRRS